MQWDQKLEIFFTYKARKRIRTHNWALKLPGDVSQPPKHWPSHYITVLTSCSQVLLLNKNKNLSSVCIKWNSRHSSCWAALANNNQHNNTKHYSNLKKKQSWWTAKLQKVAAGSCWGIQSMRPWRAQWEKLLAERTVRNLWTTLICFIEPDPKNKYLAHS